MKNAPDFSYNITDGRRPQTVMYVLDGNSAGTMFKGKKDIQAG